MCMCTVQWCMLAYLHVWLFQLLVFRYLWTHQQTPTFSFYSAFTLQLHLWQLMAVTCNFLSALLFQMKCDQLLCLVFLPSHTPSSKYLHGTSLRLVRCNPVVSCFHVLHFLDFRKHTCVLYLLSFLLISTSVTAFFPCNSEMHYQKIDI